LVPDSIDHPSLKRPPPGFEPLLSSLGWTDPSLWWEHWQTLGGLDLAREDWPVQVPDQWVTHVALPLLTRVQTALTCRSRTILGVSALPGCGKSTLCSWVKSASTRLGWSVEHLSLDDFYWPAQQLDKSMEGNPWSVPRALPGSHDISGMIRSLETWKSTGVIQAPRFDKSLRDGRGDRSGFTESESDLVILEGWFLGASPLSLEASGCTQQLSDAEHAWRPRTVSSLHDYKQVWSLLDDLWHLRAVRQDASSSWKRQQLTTLEQTSGVGYSSGDLADFNRMVQTALPSHWLHQLPSASVVMDLTSTRDVREIHLIDAQLSASSASATG